MPKPNQKHGIPRIIGGTPFSMRRSHFLDSTQKCFFGPGQPPDSGDQPGAEPDGTPVTKEYQPPTDWPPAGQLLRVPQVVFLSPVDLNRLEAPSGFTMDYSYQIFQPDNIPPDWTINLSLDTFDIASHGPAVGPQIDEFNRLGTIFGLVKDQIESLRPGRTWVDILDWGGDFAANYLMDDTTDFLLAPPLSDSVYFGTNFLHVYAGMPLTGVIIPSGGGAGLLLSPITSRLDIGYPGQGSPPGPQQSPIQGFMTFADDVVDPVPDNNTYWASSAERVRAAAANFSGYATWVYSYRFDGEGIEWHDLDDATQLDVDTNTDGSHHDPFLTNTATDPGLPTVLPTKPMFVPVYQAYLTMRNTLSEAQGSVMQAFCDPLADQGVEFRGASSQLTVDSLIAAIADHFGFDPVTGKDL